MSAAEIEQAPLDTASPQSREAAEQGDDPQAPVPDFQNVEPTGEFPSVRSLIKKFDSLGGQPAKAPQLLLPRRREPPPQLAPPGDTVPLAVAVPAAAAAAVSDAGTATAPDDVTSNPVVEANVDDSASAISVPSDAAEAASVQAVDVPEQETLLEQQQETLLGQQQETLLGQQQEKTLLKQEQEETLLEQEQETLLDREQDALLEQEQETLLDQEQDAHLDQEQETLLDQEQDALLVSDSERAAQSAVVVCAIEEAWRAEAEAAAVGTAAAVSAAAAAAAAEAVAAMEAEALAEATELDVKQSEEMNLTETETAEEAVEMKEVTPKETADVDVDSDEEVAADAADGGAHAVTDDAADTDDTDDAEDADDAGDADDPNVVAEAAEAADVIDVDAPAVVVVSDDSSGAYPFEEALEATLGEIKETAAKETVGVSLSSSASASGSASASASASSSASALSSASATASASVTTTNEDDAPPAWPAKASAKVVSGERKLPPKQVKHRRGSGLSAAAAADSMVPTSPKKRRPLLSNCARTLRNKVLDASRTMMALVSRPNDEHGSRAKLSAPSPSGSGLTPVPTDTPSQLTSAPEFNSEEEPLLLEDDSAQHQGNNSALHHPANSPLPSSSGNSSEAAAAPDTTARQPTTLSWQVKDTNSATRMSFAFVASQEGAAPLRWSQLTDTVGDAEVATFFDCGEDAADLEVSAQDISDPTEATLVSVQSGRMFSRLVRLREIN